MRILASGTLREYGEQYPDAKGALMSWLEEMEEVNYESHQQLKRRYPGAKVIDEKKVIFKIRGIITDWW